MNGPHMWDARYREEGHAYGTVPSLYLKEKQSLLKRGQHAMVPADGGGRNGVWLAEQGLNVLSADFSSEGLARGRELAAQRGVHVHFEHADLTQWSWPDAKFDWVVAIYFHLPDAVRPRIHAAMFNSLKPGGSILLEAFHTEQLRYQSGGPRDETMLYNEVKLRSDFAAADIVEFRTELVQLTESRLHKGLGMLVRMMARKP